MEYSAWDIKELQWRAGAKCLCILSTRRGLTLIETLVWITIFTLTMGAITVALLSFYRSNTYTIDQAQAVSDARRGVEDAVKIIREAHFASNGAYPVMSISEDQISFYADIDNDPLIEQVRLFVEGTQFKRGVVEPSGDPPVYTGSETESVIANNIRNIEQGETTFRYYDENGNEINDFSQVLEVRFITIDIVVNVSPDDLPNQLTLNSSATLRNLR